MISTQKGSLTKYTAIHVLVKSVFPMSLRRFRCRYKVVSGASLAILNYEDRRQ